MDSIKAKDTRIRDLKPDREQFLAEVLDGLQKPQKELPSKYFYDEYGSSLYERICALDEYYPPRTETAIMQANIEEMIELLGRNACLIEYGCGNCAKTRIVLDHLAEPAAFVPIDISGEQLRRVSQELTSAYPEIEILPVCADYTTSFELPAPEQPASRVAVYFPGSTIGNFDPLPAKDFLIHVAGVCGSGGGLLIGADLKKDPRVLHRAYNDREGVTGAFNLNLLHRINRELDGDFEPDSFRHYAFYNPRESRVEMHLISLKDQVAHLDDITVPFKKGESIWTESSYKYTLDGFARLAGEAGFKVHRIWCDEREWFSVQYLVAR